MKVKQSNSKKKSIRRRVCEEQSSYDVSIHSNKPTSKLRFIDLFCGIGGFRIAFEKAGCECVFSCDWDKFAQQTYETNFGERPNGDIRSIADTDIPEFDVLCAGFPCQKISLRANYGRWS